MQNRREFLQKGLYATPLVMTLAVKPAFAGRTYQEPEPPHKDKDDD